MELDFEQYVKEKTIKRTLEIEGGFKKEATDRGDYTPSGDFKGTKYGISARAYPDLDIENITQAEAIDIYTRDYWDKVILPCYPIEIQPMLFDMSINHGVKRANELLQRSINVEADGIVGPVTLKEIYKSNLLDLCNERNLFFAEIVAARASQSVYIKGWVSRTKKMAKFTEELFPNLLRHNEKI